MQTLFTLLDWIPGACWDKTFSLPLHHLAPIPSLYPSSSFQPPFEVILKMELDFLHLIIFAQKFNNIWSSSFPNIWQTDFSILWILREGPFTESFVRMTLEGNLILSSLYLPEVIKSSSPFLQYLWIGLRNNEGNGLITRMQMVSDTDLEIIQSHKIGRIQQCCG